MRVQSPVIRSAVIAAGLATTAALVASFQTWSGRAQTRGDTGADWPMYRRDLSGTGFSPLTQLDATNVKRLAQVWTYSLQAEAGSTPPGGKPQPAPASQATPIVVAGTMYLPAADRVVALDAATGKEIWRYRVPGGAPSRRGVAYWPGAPSTPSRIFVAAGRRLLALDAGTGVPVATFGTAGEIDIGVPYNSVPLVHRHVVVVGANTPPGTIGGVGNPRAFDALTGRKLWEFASVAQPGDVGHDTWEGDSWKGRLGANAWPFYFTVDEARGRLYLPLASPIGGAYGGDRKGANLYGNSVVAVELETGRYRWHFQTIHHDLWDADPPAPPALFDIVRDGRTVPALGVTTKSGYLYILNRETGQPIFGVEERRVAKSDAPGEDTFPTQPFPVKPPPMARNSYQPADLVTAADTTEEHARACRALVDELGGVANQGPFTPWRFRPEGAPAPVTLVFPGVLGGPNWGGTAFNRRSGHLYVTTQDVGALGWLEKGRDGSPLPYQKVTPEGRSAFDVRIGGVSWPCQKPPWGRLIAVDTRSGDIAWQVPLGITEGLPRDRQRTGRPMLAGPIVTASGLVFIASTDDNRFRALDATSGAELWTVSLPRRGNANPITYLGRDGRQYVAVVATDTLVAYAP
jgi:quinoprotein glucose dehydrogenase